MICIDNINTEIIMYICGIQVHQQVNCITSFLVQSKHVVALAYSSCNAVMIENGKCIMAIVTIATAFFETMPRPYTIGELCFQRNDSSEY